MNRHEFNERVLARQEICRQVLCGKAKEYAPDDEDRLESFARAARLLGDDVSLAEALYGMLVKHLVSIAVMMEKKQFGPAYAWRWHEKLTDTINYLHLLEACLEEEFGPGAVSRPGPPAEVV